MSRFYPLIIAKLDRETRDAMIVTFNVPPELRSLFNFTQGQHLNLRTTINGELVRRSYSICSAVSDGELRIAVKRTPGGLFSNWVNEALACGSTMEVMPPAGHFNTPLAAENRKHYLAFAAGSGITPVFSVIKTTLLLEPQSRFTLFYGNRASSTVIFKEALADLKDQYLDRFQLLFVMSREQQDIDLFNGRIDRQKCEAFFKHWVALDDIDTVFICGPLQMMEEVKTALLAHGFDPARIKVELFAASIAQHLERFPIERATDRADCEVTVIIDGRERSFPLERGKESILDAGLKQGIDLPYSCKGGVCSTCRAKLVVGEVDMDINFALEDYEVARGYILTCQSHPVTEKVVVNYDEADR